MDSMSEQYKLTTAKGSKSGTLADVWAWQQEMQGSFATLTLPNGDDIGVDDCVTLDDVRAVIVSESRP